MSDVKVNDVDDKNKVEKEDITSDDSRDVDKDSDSDSEPKKEVVKPPKKEASKTPKKEKDKTTKRQSPKKKSKAENEDTKSSGSNSSEKKVEEDDDDCEEDGDEEDAEKKKPLLDQPLEMHGARERKKVERLAISFNVPAKDKKLDIPEGEGEKLGEIPIIDFRLQKYKSEELKFFHRVLFNRAGQAAEIKKNIKRFSGFGFKPDSEEYEKKKGHLDKGNLQSLKQICEILDVERSGSKDDLITRILDFLVMPKSTGKKVPVAKGKRTRSSDRAKTPAKKPKGRSSARRSNRSKATVDDSKSESSDHDHDDDDDGDDEEEEEQEQEQEEEKEEEEMEINDKHDEKSVEKNSDDSEEEIVKPAKKEAKNKTPAKKEEKKEVKKPAPKSSNKRKKAEPSDEESSDDEPLAKKTKHPPTDGELKALIEKILDGANLEEITMKTVCKQVYGTFPEFDLSDRKDFIKKTVKSIIS